MGALTQGKPPALGYTHVSAAVLGDSIGGRNFAGTAPPFLATSAIGCWNWLNWLLGSPFVLTQNLAVDGDQTPGIFSRASSIPASVKCAFVIAGINDILNGATSQFIIGKISAGLSSLTSSGRIVLISTILPQNALAAPQLAVLLAVNTWIKSVASPQIFVTDGFASLGGDPATGAAAAGYLNADNTHPTAAGAQAFGLGAITVGKAVFNACAPDTNPYTDYQETLPLYSELRTGTGGTPGQMIYAGYSGTIADGWTVFRGAGTPVAVCDATQAYVPSANFIGAAAGRAQSGDSFTQNITYTSSAANDITQFQFIPAITSAFGTSNMQSAVYPGGKFFYEIEIDMPVAAGIAEVSTVARAYFTQGKAASFTGGTGGLPSTNLVVTAVASGNIQPNMSLLNNGVDTGVTILYQSVINAGVGNTGTYVLSAPVTLAAGTATLSGNPVVDVSFIAGLINVSAGTGSTVEAGSVNSVSLRPCRYLMRTPVVKLPENLVGSIPIQTFLYWFIYSLGNSAGSVIKFGKPRLWVNNTGRLG